MKIMSINNQTSQRVQTAQNQPNFGMLMGSKQAIDVLEVVNPSNFKPAEEMLAEFGDGGLTNGQIGTLVSLVKRKGGQVWSNFQEMAKLGHAKDPFVAHQDAINRAKQITLQPDGKILIG